VSRYREQVAAALEAVTIHGPTQYAWLGRRSRPLRAPLADDLDDAQRRRHLVSALGDELYASFYCHGHPVPSSGGAAMPVAPDPWLLAAMSRANTGRGSWDPGWRVRRIDADEAVVASDRLRVRVAVRDFEGDARAGTSGNVRMPTELPSFSPGFWTVLGDTASDPSSRGGDVRVYWHVAYRGAPALVGALTSRLNEDAEPFRLKVADHPFRMERCDAAVLYLDGDSYRRVEPALREAATALAAHLRPDVPAFTLPLAAGVGVAEDDDGQSFGARRCALLADAIVRAHEQGMTAIHARIDAVADGFAAAGVLIDAPYLAPSLAGRHVL
jgi:hypothetical protein